RRDHVSRRQVLNAFRHHWNLHRGCFEEVGHSAGVLNAFRHHWNLHRRPGSLRRPTSRSAQRLSASLESSRAARENECAVTFVLIGIFTYQPRAKELGAKSAQRLSASLESSQKYSVKSEDRLTVLNAFRHHWNLHLSTRRKTFRRPCAQRLSASLESSPGGD